MTDLVERLRERVASPFERPAVDQALMSEAATALSEAKVENERLREALKPFAGDKLPSTKPSVIDYNRHGLRCMMSPMEVAQTAAYRAINPKGGDNGEG